jgi:hypothetical protein
MVKGTEYFFCSKNCKEKFELENKKTTEKEKKIGLNETDSENKKKFCRAILMKPPKRVFWLLTCIALHVQ